MFLAFCLVLVTLLFVAIFGRIRVVVSDSMAPSIRAGDILWIKPLKERIYPGIVISYNYQGKLITHRVARIEANMIITKGDNNQEVDPWRVPTSSVVGTPVMRVPYLGYAISFMQRPIGWILFVIFPAAWIVFEEIKKIAVILRKSRSES